MSESDRAIVTKPYTAQYPDPIEFETGTLLNVEREDTEYPGWLWCRAPSGTTPRALAHAYARGVVRSAFLRGSYSFGGSEIALIPTRKVKGQMTRRVFLASPHAARS